MLAFAHSWRLRSHSVRSTGRWRGSLWHFHWASASVPWQIVASFLACARKGCQHPNNYCKWQRDALRRPVALRNGVSAHCVRACAEKRLLLERAAEEDVDAIWIENVQDLVPLAVNAPGLWIPSGITVFSKLYLEGLWAACARKGAVLDRMKIDGLAQLDAYDGVVLCAGSEMLRFPECRHFPLEPLKGQTLLCRWGSELASQFGLVGLGHITPTEYPESCQIGSTYERGFLDAAPTPGAVRGTPR